MQLSKKQKTFFEFFAPFVKSAKKMTLIAFVFPKLRTAKGAFR